MRERHAGFVARDRNEAARFPRSRRALSRSRCQEGPAGCPERGRALGGLPCAVWRKPEEERKTAAGRKPWDEIIIFKMLVLQALYNLSDDQVEYQIRDRLSFMRFLGLGLEDRVPDATTAWLYREKLAQAGLVEALFDAFDTHLKSRGYLAM